MKPWDLIVVGAGPAGSTLAGLTRKHDPSSRVLILEKARFPRHHIGESLLPGSIPVLKELGVHDKLDSAGFPRKFGAVFVWGEDRKPWDADFNNLNLEMLRTHGRLLDAEFSWQVLRSRYDEILLDHARSLGAEARMGWRAVGPLTSKGRVVGVLAEDPEGRRHELRAELTADCSGQNNFLAAARRTRAYREDLKNVAAYAYFKGARWKFEFQGHPDKTKIFVCSVPEGWFWYIPLSKDVVSVGLVSKADYVRKKGVKDMKGFFLDALSRCAEIAPLLNDAVPMKGQDPAEPQKDFFTAGDWSYVNERACGPGWLAAGDAAFFIDPLLSSGVMMAHLSGHRAAYTFLTARARPKLAKALWTDYDRFCKEVTGSFLSLVRYWYSHDPNARKWWGEAKKALKAAGPADLDDKLAFTAVAAGLTYYFERAYTTQSLVFSGAAGVEHTWQWEGTKLDLKRWTRQIIAIVETGFMKKLPGDDRVRAAEEAVRLSELPGHWRPRWKLKRRLELTFLPGAADGRLRPIKRMIVVKGGDPAADPKRVLPDCYLRALALINGRRTIGEIKARMLASSELPADVVEGQVFRILKDMAVLGAVAFDKTGKWKPTAPKGWRAGEAALKAGDPGRAVELLRGPAWALALRGEAFRHLGRQEEALDALDAAVRALDGLDELERGWVEDRVRILRAKLLLSLGKNELARADAQRAVDLNPRQSEALVLRAKADIALGRPVEAKADLERALAIETAGKRGEG